MKKISEKMKTAVQQLMLGRVCKNEKEAGRALALIREAGFSGIELNGFMIRPTPCMVRILTRLAGMPSGNAGRLDWERLVQDNGLSVPALHEALQTIEEDFAQVVETAQKFCTDRIIITGMYRFAYGNADELKRLCERINRQGDRLKKEGIRLGIHNHSVEFTRLDAEKLIIDFMMTELDAACVGMEFDAFWATRSGASPIDFIKRYGERIDMLHLTDCGYRHKGVILSPIVKTDCIELGDGGMDLSGIIKEAQKAGVSTLVLETHRNWIHHDPLSSIQRSGAYLNGLKNKERHIMI